MRVHHRPRRIKDISHDVTNYCNVKCRFCINDWSAMGKPTAMSRETFARSLKILPLLSGDFYLAALHEPTINPEFLSDGGLLAMLPPRYRKDTFFTTNLAMPMTDAQLAKMAAAPVDHINVSVNTFDRDRYAALMGTERSAFFDNLDRFAAAIHSARRPPALRFITMMLRENGAELVDIARRCRERYRPAEHEIRFPYICGNAYLRENRLSRDEALALRERLLAVGPHVVVDLPVDWERYERAVRAGAAGGEDVGAAGREPAMRPFDYMLRIASDGAAYFQDRPGDVFNLNDLDDPLADVRRRLDRLMDEDARRYEAPEVAEAAEGDDGAAAPCGAVKRLTVYNDRYLSVYGHVDGDGTGSARPDLRDFRLLAASGAGVRAYRLADRQGPGWHSAHIPEGGGVRVEFRCLIDLEPLALRRRDEVRLSLGAADGTRRKPRRLAALPAESLRPGAVRRLARNAHRRVKECLKAVRRR